MSFYKQFPRNAVSFSFAIILTIFSVNSVDAQNRARIVNQPQTQETQTTKTKVNKNENRRRGLTNKIVVVKTPKKKSLVKKTSSSKSTRLDKRGNRAYLSPVMKSMMMRSIQSKIGIRYRLGTQGPNRYDCSGFVWKVFQESGIPFTRTSARVFWRTFEPVRGDDRFEFGTLVFFNRLGHVGIVVDRNGFYHASSSKGVTYSKFKGYWSRRIVGYRRVPQSYFSWNNAVEDEKFNK